LLRRRLPARSALRMRLQRVLTLRRDATIVMTKR